MDLHEGTVEVESQGKNLGTTFTITILKANVQVATQNANIETADSEGPDVQTYSPELLHGLRVLVVDDEPDARDLLTAILTRCGSDVRCSESAAEALQAFSEWNPDVLVSDIGMPNEDGYTLLKKLRQLNARAEKIPAVALTAYATDEDRLQALSAGFQIHVAKPIEPENFVTSIASILSDNAK
ncbi:MAG: hypothetical protein DMF72_05500 [Acidobacteria bacterium]|nr:MAG: hypothetical protein DMF72_05500 [Acidobacteriota bacterium]